VPINEIVVGRWLGLLIRDGSDYGTRIKGPWCSIGSLVVDEIVKSLTTDLFEPVPKYSLTGRVQVYEPSICVQMEDPVGKTVEN
jgi:hypothetical protein